MLKKGKTKEDPTYSPPPGKGIGSVTQELTEPIPKGKRLEPIGRFMERRNKAEGKVGGRGII